MMPLPELPEGERSCKNCGPVDVWGDDVCSSCTRNEKATSTQRCDQWQEAHVSALARAEAMIAELEREVAALRDGTRAIAGAHLDAEQRAEKAERDLAAEKARRARRARGLRDPLYAEGYDRGAKSREGEIAQLVKRAQEAERIAEKHRQEAEGWKKAGEDLGAEVVELRRQLRQVERQAR